MSLIWPTNIARCLLASLLVSTAVAQKAWSVPIAIPPQPTVAIPAIPPLQPRAGEPVRGLSAQQLAKFELGKKKFRHVFSTPEGLGPGFNNTSCVACHGQPDPTASIPAGGSSIGLTMSTRRFGLDQGGVFDPLVNLGGSLLQSQSTSTLPQCQEVVPAQANVVSARLTTPAFGAGLVESIPDASIVAGMSNPYVSGRAHLVAALEDPAGSRLRAGRFGWKSQVATVLSFSSDASLNELGLTNRFLQNENAPQGNQAALAVCDTVADPEDQPDSNGVEFIDHISSFQKFLAAPPQTPKSGMAGEVLFNQIGCAQCHKAIFVTSNSTQIPAALRSKVIQPYSDFLLHDMGAGGDGIAQGAATQREMRTAPLWGLKLRSFFWHDGSQSMFSVSGLNDIILGVVYPWATFYGHNAPGSEAASSAQAYSLLSTTQRDDLFRFLKSLGQAEFNLNSSDNRINRSDIAPMKACLTAAGPFNADASCAVADIDQDGYVNSTDLGSFIQAYQEPQFDCDCDGQNDLKATVLGSVADVNTDGYPDICNVQLNLSVGPSYPLPSWDELQLGQTMDLVVSGAMPGSTVYVLVTFAAGGGTSTGILPAPYNNLCLNLPTAQNFIPLLGGPVTLTANTYGAAVFSAVIPNVAPFVAGSEIRFQAFSLDASGYRRSALLSKKIEL